MNKIKEDIHFHVWCFGHFHADRLERPYVEQYYNDMEELNTVYKRWKDYDKIKDLPWYLVKGQNFYANN